ncbi:hypothetical protein [Sedimentibacter sp.]|uniref:hypothetical protein n=2 Tax=Sedimentibacter sp. TaxID=1960295 RepID=UPI0028A70872|nr:hypothetical protein [Sedimentibacter sp.]
MVMKFLTGILTDFLDIVINLLNDLFGRFDISPFTQHFDFLVQTAEKANVIFPIKEILEVLTILMTFAFYSLVFWAIQKIYEMVRG